MAQLSKQTLSKLEKIISLAQKMIASSEVSAVKTRSVSKTKRIRRSGKELAAFRRMLKAERKSGVSVAEMAEKHNVSTAYIYTLK